jgi:FHS family L-fucose permease-like MFS transporter
MAIVGGALIPPLTGHIADVFTLRTALLIPGLCHVGILLYGLYARRPAAAAVAA